MAGFPQLFAEFAADTLTWWPARGIGYYPVRADAAPYDEAYFARYAAQADSAIGRRLNAARLNLVERYLSSLVVDIGIGAGTFVAQRIARGHLTMGYDVNPAGVRWLQERGLLAELDPSRPFYAITCWDVLEHIRDFRPLLARVVGYVFLSIPIFADAAHVRRSKHFRPDEHYWYFTQAGLIETFAALGFACLEANDEETRIGREDIMSFVFKRRHEAGA